MLWSLGREIPPVGCGAHQRPLGIYVGHVPGLRCSFCPKLTWDWARLLPCTHQHPSVYLSHLNCELLEGEAPSYAGMSCICTGPGAKEGLYQYERTSGFPSGACLCVRRVSHHPSPSSCLLAPGTLHQPRIPAGQRCLQAMGFGMKQTWG